MEFQISELKLFLNKLGIIHQFSASYVHQQNGVVERYHRIVTKKVNCWIIWSKITNEFWGYTVLAVNYIKNRSYI